ncbi:MAG TPA: glycosyltransferase [Alphaproteobacteria bacterium]|nr:glycosyltransferase [Alphaproteobacteria bacterium]
MPKDTIGIISSFPAQGGEIASANAISRYTYLLSKSFPKNQKLIIFCEKRSNLDLPYQLSKNILVVPSFKYNSTNFANQLMSQINNFPQIKNILVQFEFSIFGKVKVIPAFLLLLTFLKFNGKNLTLTLHQVTTDLNSLSGHLGLTKNSWLVKIFNIFLNFFYITVGALANKIIVHDELLKNRLTGLIPGSKISVIPHAVGEVKRQNLKSARKYFGLFKKDKVITVFGYRSWYKGTDWIIQTMTELAKQYPKESFKLLVAGGVSPTLETTSAYQAFNRQLERAIASSKSVITTGFVPEKDVRKVFAASDIIVFPYRTRMSASGAFSLALAYNKPFLVSRGFSEGLNLNLEEAIFDFNILCFEEKLFGLLKNGEVQEKISNFTSQASKNKSWSDVASLYLTEVKRDNILTKDVKFTKTFALAGV